MTQAQLTRMFEFQSDFCELEEEDFQNPNFINWYEDYNDYVRYGTPSEDSRGSDRPDHKPPTP